MYFSNKKFKFKNTVLISIYPFLSSRKGKHIVSSYLAPARRHKFTSRTASFPFFLLPVLPRCELALRGALPGVSRGSSTSAVLTSGASSPVPHAAGCGPASLAAGSLFPAPGTSPDIPGHCQTPPGGRSVPTLGGAGCSREGRLPGSCWCSAGRPRLWRLQSSHI